MKHNELVIGTCYTCVDTLFNGAKTFTGEFKGVVTECNKITEYEDTFYEYLDLLSFETRGGIIEYIDRDTCIDLPANTQGIALVSAWEFEPVNIEA